MATHEMGRRPDDSVDREELCQGLRVLRGERAGRKNLHALGKLYWSLVTRGASHPGPAPDKERDELTRRCSVRREASQASASKCYSSWRPKELK